MRLLCVIDSLAANGGAEQALVGMIPYWVSSGTDVHIATLVRRPGLEQHAVSAGAWLHMTLGSRGSRVRQLRRLVQELRPDLVHTTLFESDLAGRLAAAAGRVPVVTSLVNTPYGLEHRGDPSLRASRVRAAHLADALSAQAVRRFHALTEHVAATMSKRLLVPRSRMTVIPRGRDAETLGRRTSERRAHVRQRLGLDTEVPVVLAASRQEHQKGLDVIVDAVATLPAPSRPVLLLAGRAGGATASLTDRVAARELSAWVRFLGVRADVPDLMCAADVFALPSRWEGLGSVLVEAMCLETPIVASDVPAIRETLGPEGRASLVRPDDAQALAGALASAIEAPSAVRQSTAALRARFQRLYTLERVSAAMSEFHSAAAASH